MMWERNNLNEESTKKKPSLDTLNHRQPLVWYNIDATLVSDKRADPYSFQYCNSVPSFHAFRVSLLYLYL